MKIKLIIASGDDIYAEHLSKVLSDKYSDAFEVSVCSSIERLTELVSKSKYDAALLEPGYLIPDVMEAVRLPLLLNDSFVVAQGQSNLRKINKHQRISSIAGTVMEYYAELGSIGISLGVNRAHITAVWSPGGGVGKTTVSLAYAARKVADGKHATYLNLENFSSTSAYFTESGKSISTVFEKLETDVPMLLMGIRQQDSGSGITYFCGPDNYDDINILTTDDLSTLIKACAANTDEVVIDLSSQCNEKTRKIFDLADTLLLVCDQSAATSAKINQFVNQHNIAQLVQDKCVLICNKGAKHTREGFHKSIQLPLVQSTDAVSVYKSLSGNAFEW